MIRIWVLTNAPSPYQLEFLRELERQERATVSVRLMRDRFRGGTPLDTSRYRNFQVMYGIGVPGENDELIFHPRAVFDSVVGHYDCFVLSGLYTSPTFLVSAILLFLRRKPFVLWLERPSNRPPPASFIARVATHCRVKLRRSILKILFRLSAKVICIGSLAAKQYQQLGLPSSKTAVVPYCSDSSRFAIESKKRLSTQSTENEKQRQFQFLFSGQLIPRKGIDTLLDVFSTAKKLRPHITLTILGDGPLRPLVEAAQASMGDCIRLLGHVDQEKLPKLFASADAFLFPSRHDGWGVVLNEACAAALPIIASEETGAAHDLIDPGENGFRIPCDDREQWVDRMIWMFDHRDALISFGRHSLLKSQICSTSFGASRMHQVLLDLIRKQ